MTSVEELRYDQLVERALRSVVRDALQQVADHGLPGEHHFYITFSTQHPGVSIPDYLREQYQDEMTIVLQYQFYDLEVDDERFAVSLSFNNQSQRLEIPLASISTFADPSVNFALQFQLLPGDDDDESEADLADDAPADGVAGDGPVAALAPPEGGVANSPGTGDDGGDNVVTLDSFRKK